MVLELARDRAFDRPMPRVVHPGCDLVGEEVAADVEQLDTAHADVVEVVEQGPDRGEGAGLKRVVEIGRGCEGQAENAVTVVILDRGPTCDLAVAAAHRQYRELAVEVDEALEDARGRAELHVVGVDVGGIAHDRLALAVVAAPSGLEHRGQPDRVDGGAQVGFGVDRVERRGRDPERVQGLLLDDPVLGHLERGRRRKHRRERLERTRGRRGDALPFVRDHIRIPRRRAARPRHRRDLRRPGRRPRPPVPPIRGRGIRTSIPAGSPRARACGPVGRHRAPRRESWRETLASEHAVFRLRARARWSRDRRAWALPAGASRSCRAAAGAPDAGWS